MISDILLVFACIYLLFGAVGINRQKGVLAKLLTSSLIDACSFIILIIALILKCGFTVLSVKLIIVLMFILLTNPVINHYITRAAYKDQRSKEEV